MHGVYCPQTNSRVHMADSAELARIKSTPTDTELATQIDEVESKVRVRCPSYQCHRHTLLQSTSTMCMLV